MNAFTGPWEIIAIGHGSSYELKHVVTGKLGKSHATHLSPFPCQLSPFKSLDQPDTAYGQLYKALEKDPYKDASIKGFQPYEPYYEEVLATSLLSPASTPLPSRFPTLTELNAEMDDWTVEERLAIEADNDVYVYRPCHITYSTSDSYSSGSHTSFDW